MKTILFLLLLGIMASCQKPPQRTHEISVETMCDTGGDCWRGVFIEFYAEYPERLTIEGYLPDSVYICSIDLRKGEGGYEYYTEPYYMENLPGYFYLYTDVPAATKLYIFTMLSENDLPVQDSLMWFGNWVTHFDQQENPTYYTLLTYCPW